MPLELFCAPGNAAFRKIAKCVPIAATNHASLTKGVPFRGYRSDYCGPEGSLADGIVDEFERVD